MVDATKVSKIKIDTGYAGKKVIHFLLERIKTVRLFLMLKCLSFLEEMVQVNQQLPAL